jgi:hypothetical protein
MATRRIHSPNELYDAIERNNYPVVKSYLDSGGDPNVNLASFVTTYQDFSEVLITLCSDGTSLEGILSPLHLAVVNCYNTSAQGRSSAMKILKAFLKVGANAFFTVVNFRIYCWGRREVLAAKTPLDLAILVKNLLAFSGSARSARIMNEMIQLLEAAEIRLREAALQKDSDPVTVPKSVANTWKALLFSEDFSDVKFKCQDGTMFHAHKCVLAAASPYFSAAFRGPWGQHEDGLWETSNPAPVMKAALSFIYTGEATSRVMEQQPEVVFAVASEYSLPELRQLCEASCTRSLGINNVKSMLQFAHLQGSSALKQSCFDFVQKNMAKVLVDPAVVSLISEDAELWAELVAAISPDSGRDNMSEGSSKKRGRSSERS